MSHQILIDICSNCKQHSWCTRHNEATYLSLAQELKKQILSSLSDAQIKINLVGGQKMGSFEVSCKGITIFSKLELGYFPHTVLLTNRIIAFFDDVKKGNDLQKYNYSHSPIKHHPTFKKQSSKSPEKPHLQSTTPNSSLVSESSNKKNQSQVSNIAKPKEAKQEKKLEEKKEQKVTVQKEEKKQIRKEERKQTKKEQKKEDKRQIQKNQAQQTKKNQPKQQKKTEQKASQPIIKAEQAKSKPENTTTIKTEQKIKTNQDINQPKVEQKQISLEKSKQVEKQDPNGIVGKSIEAHQNQNKEAPIKTETKEKQKNEAKGLTIKQTIPSNVPPSAQNIPSEKKQLPKQQIPESITSKVEEPVKVIEPPPSEQKKQQQNNPTSGNVEVQSKIQTKGVAPNEHKQ